ncbi:VTT domain-containing protein [Pseudoalteromonas sp. BDTF-M6]|uniref:YqaA family protein n=1 Tax=Pseudoalteromonas sp. BDTF-M6 TaxID=2796132 RepID=UPI001BAEDB97|nr:VTT domain-containing protein [Pseudoalteromonas sp. BDTF-M6]MBS3796190.1 DedA family protein [Pseudoalteromonas sp. BDTF-M6]
MGLYGRLVQKTRQWIHSRHMLWGVTLASFLESTIVPVPLEALLVPLMQARRDKIWAIALVATLGCMLGALFGYALGYYLFDVLGDWLIDLFSTPEQFANVKAQMHSQGFWFVLTLGIVPIPFQIAMLAAGATHYSLWLFFLATAIARSLRYFGLALVVHLAGNQAEKVIRKHKMKGIAALSALVLGTWWLVSSLSTSGVN